MSSKWKEGEGGGMIVDTTQKERKRMGAKKKEEMETRVQSKSRTLARSRNYVLICSVQ